MLFNIYKVKLFTNNWIPFSCFKLLFLILIQINHSLFQVQQPKDYAEIIDTKFLPTPKGSYGENSRFGSIIDVHENRAVVAQSGGIYVYEFNQSEWQQTALIKPSNSNEWIVGGLAISLFGDNLLIGVFTDDGISEETGAAYIYEWNGENWRQSHKLVASNGSFEDYFGRSVSLNADRAIIGAPREDGSGGNGRNSGAAYVFDWNGDSWAESQILRSNNNEFGDNFGYSVSLEGDRAVIGAVGDDNDANNTGSAFVFELNKGLWSSVKKLTATNRRSYDYFGTDVKLLNNRILVHASGNGAAVVYDWSDTQWLETQEISPLAGSHHGAYIDLDADKLIIGAPYADDNLGAAYIYEWNGINWIETQKLSALIGNIEDFFGVVALEGDHILVGAPTSNNNIFLNPNEKRGVTHAFEWDGMSYVNSQIITPLEGSNYDNFGQQVSLHGNHAVIGAPGDDTNFRNTGSAYVYKEIGEKLNKPQKLIPSGLSLNAGFGTSVSVHNDRVLIGAPGDIHTSNYIGSVLLYDWDGLSWIESDRINVEAIAERTGSFGQAVSLNGDRFVVGDPRGYVNGVFSGAVYVFDWNGNGWIHTQTLSPSDGLTSDQFGHSVSLSGNQIIVGANKSDSNGNNTGSVYVFEYQGSSWIEKQKLIASDAMHGENFGHSVSLDGDWAVISALYGDRSPGGLNNENIGSVYVFFNNGVDWQETQVIYASDAQTYDEFGASVSLNGTAFLVGASQSFQQTPYINNPGKAYLFELTDSLWQEKRQLKKPAIRLALDGFGTSVSLFGTNALIGVPGTNEHGINSGGAYIFGGDLIYHHNFDE